MRKELLQQKLFKEFINYQLKPHGIKYNDVKDDPQWYMRYCTTVEEECKFKKYIVSRCIEVLKLSKKAAENEASWFILQWGLTTNKTSSYSLLKKIKTKEAK